jgi:Family of unknown function (DUF6882)
MVKLTEYLEQFALHSLEKQDKLALLLGDFTHVIDIDARTIRINDGLEISFQVLGTESDNTMIWLWAWADEQPEDIPEDLIQASRELREWGLQKGIQEFSIPSLDLHKAEGHALSMIACELCNASCYFRDAYEGGSAFLLLFDKRIDAQPSFDLLRLSHRFLDLISRYELNHRNALLSYLRLKKLPLAVSGLTVTCELGSRELLSAEFDDTGRLMQLNEAPISF